MKIQEPRKLAGMMPLNTQEFSMKKKKKKTEEDEKEGNKREKN